VSEELWRQTNQAWWDERAPIHLASDFYDVEAFRTGKEMLQPHELDELGDVRGKSLVHLQCHIGLDTLAWARRGAQVTGVDFSEPAIEAARSMANELEIEAKFILADVYEANSALGLQRFDVVYTGHGALPWLPDIERWAKVVEALLNPGGCLYLSEFHPLSEVLEEGLYIGQDYFTAQPAYRERAGSYTDSTVVTNANAFVQWTHPLGEVVTAIIDAGLRLEFLHEREHLLYPRWSFLEKWDDGTWRFPAGRPRVPLRYSLRACKLP
jgi:2-polyprenyl-3-methyl-5-hydroxy-6-metoxy-1,4-benzoquinol methylase